MLNRELAYFFLFYNIFLFHPITTLSLTCRQLDVFYSIHHCLVGDAISKYSPANNQLAPKNIYILYDINRVEGFNLRRDVYIRLAVFLKALRTNPEYSNAKLVLPPFHRLYHWKSSDIAQTRVFWNHFFDLDSLKQYTAVLDIWEYFEEIQQIMGRSNKVVIDHVFMLQNFQDFFDENGTFFERFVVEHSESDVDEAVYFGYRNLTVRQKHTITYQGSVMMVYDLLEQFRKRPFQNHFSVLIDHAEIVLHDHWGNVDFWQARRSMRFNQNLVAVATQYRQTKLNSNDQFDNVQRPDDWQLETPYRNAIGGNYICAHLRRADFLYGRENTTPTLRSAALQIKEKMRQFNIENAFVASDCSRKEFKDLKSFLPRIRVQRFTPSTIDEREQLKDGGIAIIDQIICSHARYFIGTYESTFTYRIYEEREILGFPQKTTFNTFCKNDFDSDKNCLKNSVWPIEY